MFWNGIITVLLNKLKASRNSSALEPNPPPSARIPNNNGLVTLCPDNTLFTTSLDKNW